jgi:phenylalanyl-tRNA synthetase beta chain
MPTITISKEKVKKIIGNLKDEEIDNILNMAELGVEKITNEEIDIEITPNRPDLLSIPGLIRYLNNYFKKSKIKEYKVEKPEKDYKVIIDKTVKKVRPYTTCAIIKNLKFDDEKIKEIVDIQEKLHGSYGRNRKKLAIGIYPLEVIKLPITFKALKPEEIKFQPLELNRVINGRQILSQHSAGRAYGDLLKGKEVFPIFIDSNDEILSMPPIINSHKTGKINEKTKEVFVECSGFNKEYLQKTLNMIVTTLSDMGGKIYSMEIIDGKEKTLSPNLEPEKMKISIENINNTIGLDLSSKEIKNNLAKMGIDYEKDHALIPAYRTDILHEVDIAEDVAIAYGFDKLIPDIPKISTIGQESKESIKKRKIQDILTGLDLIEISTYHLSTKEKQFKKINLDYKNQPILEVIDSKTENNILRNSLLATNIQILSENSDASYPQKIFEIGPVFYLDEEIDTGVGESLNLAISICYEKANFTELKQILDYLMRMLNLNYEIKPTSHPSFIEGRAGEIIINEKPIGILGEIKPIVLKNNKIKMPVATLEINLKEF